MLFLITGTLAVISLFVVASPCPSVCSCSDTQKGIYVDCSNRGLGSIPKDIPNNTYFLDIWNNKISFIEEHAFSNLLALTYIYLYNNNISVIKVNTFSNLPLLNYIELANNDISEIERGAFNNLPSFEVVILNQNKISVIEDHTFSNLPALAGVSFHHNQISEIKRGAFNNLPAFASLDLADNNITRVESWLFSGMPIINTIFMSENNISFVSEKTFQNLSRLAYLHFTMFCGCNFNIPFWQWLKVSKKFPESIGCYDYPKLYLENLEQGDFYKCNEASSTPTATTSRTTATPTSRTTMTTTSAARITRKKLEATPFTFRAVIGIAIGAGSLAGGILLFCVIWRLWRPSKDKVDKFEQQPDKINSVIPAKPPSTFPQRPTVSQFPGC